MKHLTLSTMFLAASLLPASGCAAADHDFNAVVSGVESRFAIHAQRMPMMGFVSLCARFATHGGVKGMRIAEFDNLAHDLDSQDLLDVVRSKLGEEWQPIVTERASRNGELSVIFVRPAGRSMRMLIADYEHGELDVVRMELNGDELARFMHDPAEHPHHPHHAEYTPENAQ
jgi:hypothetical protein